MNDNKLTPFAALESEDMMKQAGFGDWLEDTTNSAWNWGADRVSDLGDGLSAVGNNIGNIASGAYDVASAPVRTAWNTATALPAAGWNAIGGFIDGAGDGDWNLGKAMKGGWNAGYNSLAEDYNDVVDAGQNAFNGAGRMAVNLGQLPVNGMTAGMGGIDGTLGKAYGSDAANSFNSGGALNMGADHMKLSLNETPGSGGLGKQINNTMDAVEAPAQQPGLSGYERLASEHQKPQTPALNPAPAPATPPLANATPGVNNNPTGHFARTYQPPAAAPTSQGVPTASAVANNSLSPAPSPSAQQSFQGATRTPYSHNNPLDRAKMQRRQAGQTDWTSNAAARRHMAG